MVKGTITGILSVLKIRKVLKKMSEVNEATVGTALESEKKSQSQPKVPIEYQQGFTEESATDASLNRKQVVAYLFLDSQVEIVMNELRKTQNFYFDLQIHSTLLNSTYLHCQVTGFISIGSKTFKM